MRNNPDSYREVGALEFSEGTVSEPDSVFIFFTEQLILHWFWAVIGNSL
ncbi:MAG: hypothetical protein WAU01_06445 [Saprospiraceae bacterium]